MISASWFLKMDYPEVMQSKAGQLINEPLL